MHRLCTTLRFVVRSHQDEAQQHPSKSPPVPRERSLTPLPDDFMELQDPFADPMDQTEAPTNGAPRDDDPTLSPEQPGVAVPHAARTGDSGDEDKGMADSDDEDGASDDEPGFVLADDAGTDEDPDDGEARHVEAPNSQEEALLRGRVVTHRSASVSSASSSSSRSDRSSSSVYSATSSEGARLDIACDAAPVLPRLPLSSEGRSAVRRKGQAHALSATGLQARGIAEGSRRLSVKAPHRSSRARPVSTEHSDPT